MNGQRPAGKPFDISKQEVWDAYLKVRADKGAPGADGCTIEDFEKDLKGNLYKIWNRMASGSYFPPPVLEVEIPKPQGGGVRILGVPTGSRRRSWPSGWRRSWSRGSMPTPTGIGRAGRRMRRWPGAGNGAGAATG